MGELFYATQDLSRACLPQQTAPTEREEDSHLGAYVEIRNNTVL